MAIAGCVSTTYGSTRSSTHITTDPMMSDIWITDCAVENGMKWDVE